MGGWKVKKKNQRASTGKTFHLKKSETESRAVDGEAPRSKHTRL